MRDEFGSAWLWRLDYTLHYLSPVNFYPTPKNANFTHELRIWSFGGLELVKSVNGCFLWQGTDLCCVEGYQIYAAKFSSTR